MISGIWHEKCPQCGGVYIFESECGNYLEEYSWCNRCGKKTESSVARDKDGNVCFDVEGNVIWNNIASAGYGCFAIARDEASAIYHLTEPVNETIKQDFFKAIEEEGVIKEECYLTSWDDEKKELIAIFGKLPETYDEMMSEYEHCKEENN